MTIAIGSAELEPTVGPLNAVFSEAHRFLCFRVNQHKFVVKDGIAHVAHRGRNPLAASSTSVVDLNKILTSQ